MADDHTVEERVDEFLVCDQEIVLDGDVFDIEDDFRRFVNTENIGLLFMCSGS
jgi:hypothetical protein